MNEKRDEPDELCALSGGNGSRHRVLRQLCNGAGRHPGPAGHSHSRNRNGTGNSSGNVGSERQPGQPRHAQRRGGDRSPGQAGWRGLSARRLSLAEQVVAAASLLIALALFLPWFGIHGVGASLTWTGLTAHGYLAVALLPGLGLPGYLTLRAGWQAPPR